MKQGCWLAIPGGDLVWVDFQYEKLHNFCYICWCHNHNDKDCDVELFLKSENRGIVQGNNSILRAEMYSSSKVAGSFFAI